MRLLFAVLLVTLSGCSETVTERFGGSIVGVLRRDKNIGGTAFYIRPDLLASAGHVCESTGPVAFIRNQDGKEGQATVVATPSDVRHDICLLSTALEGPSLKLAPNIKLGEEVVALGHGLGYPIWEAHGRVIAPEQEIYIGKCDPFSNLMELPGCIVIYLNTMTTANVAPGHSGSPMFSRRGVVGVVSTGSPQGISGVAAVEQLHKLLKEFEKGK